MFGRRSLLSGSRICPYCFEPFGLRSAPFRCSSPPSVCAPERDEVRDRVWRDSRPLGRVFEPRHSFVRSQRCPHCRHEAFKRLCPHCHQDIPPGLLDCDSYIFAVIGAKESGKSHYIAVLVQQLRNSVGPALKMSLEGLDEETIRRYRETFYEPVYKRKTTIGATRSALSDNAVQMPLLYSLTFEGKKRLGRRRIEKSVALIFFDTAGEDLNSSDVMATVNKYIYRSDGIILLLDPLQLDFVRDQMGNSAALPMQNTETADILTRTTDLIRKGRRLSMQDMISTPLAIAFSKFDAVDQLVAPHFQIAHSAQHRGGFDRADFDAVGSEMESLISRWHGEGLLQQVRTRFQNHAFFGLTALGCAPLEDNRIPRVVPRRVEDPFLWLLYHHGLIRAIS